MIHSQKKYASLFTAYLVCTFTLLAKVKERCTKEPIVIDIAACSSDNTCTQTPHASQPLKKRVEAQAPINTNEIAEKTAITSPKQPPTHAEVVAITNRIKRTEIPHRSKWGTYTPKTFDVTLTVRLEPEKTITIPRALLESGDVEIQCAFTFKQGLYSRSETYSEQLKLPQSITQELDLAFRWEKPRFSLQAATKPQKKLPQATT